MLNVILKRSGVTTGPRRKHTSHSSMEVIKKDLLGLPQFKGGEKFLWFGSALHEAFLEGKYNGAYKLLTPQEKRYIVAMVKKLNANPVVAALMKNSIREHKFAIKINGVNTVVILDAKQLKLKRGFDLKTTTCTTQKEFEAKMIELSYVRQGKTYQHAAKLNQFYFVAINKEPPFDIFILDINAKHLKQDTYYAEQELKFLLYFYKNHGKTIQRKQADAPNKGGVRFIHSRPKVGKQVKVTNKEANKRVSKGGRKAIPRTVNKNRR